MKRHLLLPLLFFSTIFISADAQAIACIDNFLALFRRTPASPATPEQVAAAQLDITPAVTAGDDWRNLLQNREWRATAPSLTVNPRFAGLPQAVQERFRNLRQQGNNAGFTRVTAAVFDRKNRLTNIKRKRLSELLSPKMRAPHARAIEMLSDTGRWNDYFEDTMGEVFTRMMNSGDPRLVAAAGRGEFSEAVLMEMFRERFARRGVNIAVIEPGAKLLSFRQFRAKLREGVIWDRAFEGNYLTSHGPFPHLFQLDYVLDDMVQASGGQVTRSQEFFDYWGGSNEGLAVWNDMFDLFSEKASGHHSLRDTYTVTNEYLSRFPRIP